MADQQPKNGSDDVSPAPTTEVAVPGVTTRRLVVALSATALAGAIVLVISSLGDRPGITLANYRRIQPGVTRAEVEALLDGPPGDYCTEETLLIRDPSLPFGPEDEGELWMADGGGVLVAFDASQRVTSKVWLIPEYGPKWSLRRMARKIKNWWASRNERRAAFRPIDDPPQ